MRVLNYKPKACSKCGELFTPRNSRHEWCDNCLTKQCVYCGADFHIEKRTKYESAKYCSVECKGKFASEHRIGVNGVNYKNGNRLKVEISCDYCGEKTLKEQQFIDKFEKNFCNRKCQIAYYRAHSDEVSGENSPLYSQVEMRCEWCGGKYKVMKCFEAETRFCSKQCRHDWQSDMMKGENHYNWKGGKTAKRQLDMVSREYRTWRESVFARDSYTCKMCGDDRGGNLNAHHIKPYKDYPDLRHDVDNGITLCKQCHINVHSIGELDIQSELPI